MFEVLLNEWKFVLAGIAAGIICIFVVAYLVERKVRHKALLKSQKFCRRCGGTGRLEDRSNCPTCKGTGIPPICPVCGGDGKIDAEKRCSYCMGTGVEIL